MNLKENVKLSKHDVRINNILGLLNKHKFLSIIDMSNYLDVSTMTIRRDCEELSKDGFIKLKNGIIFLRENEDVIPTKRLYDLKKQTSVKYYAKQAIGKYAASLVNNGETIIIDTGTTTEMVISNIHNVNVNLFCSNLNILNQAVKKEGFTVMFSGGNYHPDTQMFESQQSLDFISNIRANKVFLSAAGVHEGLGLTCSPHEVGIKQAIMASANKRILLTDSSKFGKVRSAYFCNLDEIDEIITDNEINKEWIEIINNLGIVLHIVNP